MTDAAKEPICETCDDKKKVWIEYAHHVDYGSYAQLNPLDANGTKRFGPGRITKWACIDCPTCNGTGKEKG